MAYVSISNLLIQVGKPVIKTLWDLVQGNLDDHEARIAGVEQGATKIEVWDDVLKVRRNAASLTGMDAYKSIANMQLIEATVALQTAVGGATGIIEFDILKAPTLDFSAAVSVFTTKPSLSMAGAADFDQSVNAVFDVNEQDILKNERLRLDITSLPVGLSSFEIFLLGELN